MRNYAVSNLTARQTVIVTAEMPSEAYEAVEAAGYEGFTSTMLLEGHNHRYPTFEVIATL